MGFSPSHCAQLPFCGHSHPWKDSLPNTGCRSSPPGGTGEIPTSTADRQQGWSGAIRRCVGLCYVCTSITPVVPNLKFMSPASAIFAFDSIYTLYSI